MSGSTKPADKSNGYQEVAEEFMRARNPRMGTATVQAWSHSLPPGAAVLDLGCGNGVPISQALIYDGFDLYAVDASAKMIAAFRERFPQAHAECAAVEDSAFFNRTFDGVIAWGLMFLLPAGVQTELIVKISRALNFGGKLLFTAPREAVAWADALTGRQSISMGLQNYQGILSAQGLVLADAAWDDGDNHYYLVSKP